MDHSGRVIDARFPPVTRDTPRVIAPTRRDFERGATGDGTGREFGRLRPRKSFAAHSDREAWQPTDFLPDLSAPRTGRNSSAPSAPGGGAVATRCSSSWSATWSPRRRCPATRSRSTTSPTTTTGTERRPWARWLRGWTAEENRHGDLLNAYLRLTGRVDMRAVEVTVHHLINNGFNPRVVPRPVRRPGLHRVPGAGDEDLARQRRPARRRDGDAALAHDLPPDRRRRGAARDVLHEWWAAVHGRRTPRAA